MRRLLHIKWEYCYWRKIWSIFILLFCSFVHHSYIIIQFPTKFLKIITKKAKLVKTFPAKLKKIFELTINSQVFSKEIIFKLVRTAIRNHNQSVIYPTQEEHNRRKCNCIWKNRMYFIVSGYSLGQNGNMLIYIKVQLIIYFYYNSLNVLT